MARIPISESLPSKILLPRMSGRTKQVKSSQVKSSQDNMYSRERETYLYHGPSPDPHSLRRRLSVRLRRSRSDTKVLLAPAGANPANQFSLWLSTCQVS